MPLKLHNKNMAPAGGYRFFCKETGVWIQGIDPVQSMERIKAHYKANSIPIGLLFNEMVENQWCMNTDASACFQEGYGNAVPTRSPTTYEQLKMATGILLQWFLKGSRKEPIAEVKRRSKICVQCPYNQVALGCPTCGLQPFKDLVDKFVGGEATEYDPQISACRICGCSLQAKVRIPLDILKQHEPEFIQGAYPEWCWLKTQPSPI